MTDHPRGPAVSAEDARIARDLWAKLGRPEMAWPSASQLLAFMREAPDHIAEGAAARLLRDAETAARIHVHHPRQQQLKGPL